MIFQVASKEDVVQYLDQIRSRYPDVTHVSYAYAIGDQEKSSDDGEPAGTAGKPILHAIKQSGYDHILLVVVRYFGGTLLGAGGLVRAYGSCARQTLVQAPVEQSEVLQHVSLVCEYDDMAVVMQCVEKFQVRIVSQEAGVLLQVICSVNAGLVDEFVSMIRKRSGGRVEIVVNYKL